MQFSKWVTLGFGALCLVAVAGVLNAQHLYYMAAILLTLPGVSYALGWHMLRGLEFTREPLLTAWEGEEGGLVYEVTNRTQISRFFLSMHEPLPLWITPVESDPPLFNVAAGDTVRIVQRVHFDKRGACRLHGFDVTAMDPLGVFAFTRHVAAETELIVYPIPQAMPPLTLSGAERYGWQEFTSVALRGGSIDPDGVRAYTPGDPLRHIHWRQTARTGKLSVIEFEEALAVNLVMILDLQRGTNVGQGTETTLEYAVRLAASMSQQAIQQGASVRLVEAQEMPESGRSGLLSHASTAGHGQEHLFAILERLARVEAVAEQPVSAVVNASVENIAPGTTLLVLTSRMDRDLASALTRHTISGVNAAVIYIDPDSFRRANHKFTHLEDEFFADLMAAQVHPFVLRRNSYGDVYPEAVTHAFSR